MKKSLTAPFVDSVQPPENVTQYDIWDTRLRGFGLRLSCWGRKTWIAMYRHGGRKRRFTIGTYPPLTLADARERARCVLAEAAKGSDPASTKKQDRNAEVFAGLAALYLERYAKREKKERSAREDERIINSELLPVWRNLKARELRRDDVITLLDRIVDRRAPVMANRTRALISRMFNFAIERGLVEANPATGVRNPGGAEQTRDRTLSADEIRRLWVVLDSENPKIAALFRLLLLTAQRKSEVVGIDWAEIDFESGWWTIPKERSKNGLAHRVPLTPETVRILRALKKKESSGPLFPSGQTGQPFTTLAKPLRRLIAQSGVQFHIHDLRRTAASQMTSIGIPRLVVSKLLNHVERDITATYDRHSYDGEKRTALLKWDRRLREMISGASAEKVVPIHG